MKRKRILKRGIALVDSRLRSNQILWRYFDLAKFLDFVMYGRVFFARGDKYPDKFEGSFTASLRTKIKNSYNENQSDFSYEEFRKRLRERVFLNCWHRGPDDSMAMWAIYGGSQPSIAITTTVGKLKSALDESLITNYISIRKVSYIRHWNDPEIEVNPYSNIFSYKVKAYDYEKEVRVIIDRFKDNFDDEMIDEGMYVNVSINQILRSIVISPEAPPWFKDLINGVVGKYKISAPIRKSRLENKPI